MTTTTAAAAEIRWDRLTAPELKALATRDALVLLPVGSLEQHGPHLPVWTDSFIAHAMAVRPALERAFSAGLPAVVNALTDPAIAYPRRSNLA